MHDWTVYWRMALLGAIQGITEFIPVSSSGHLVLGRHFLNLDTGGGTLVEIVLHAGSLISIWVYYRRRILQMARGWIRHEPEARRETGWILLGCIPVIVAYAAAGRWITAWFERPWFAAGALCVTGLIVLSCRWARPADAAIGFRRALWIGGAQAATLLPGISRSGTTITVARHLGIPGDRAAEFSFLMAVPLLLGATLVGVYELRVRGAHSGVVTPGALALGFVVSAGVGLAAIDLLVRTLRRRGFAWFGLYALGIGISALVLLHLNIRFLAPGA